MRKLIAGINITPDGFCDHRYAIADDELHQFFSDLMKEGDTILHGRKTFQLMEAFWPEVAKNKTGTEADIDFAETLDDMQKIVFSKSGFTTPWRKTTVLTEIDVDYMKQLKASPGGNIYAGSPSVIDQLTEHGLVDEYIYVVHPIIAGNGKRFFESTSLREGLNLQLFHTKIFKSGVIALFYRKTE